MKKVRNLLPNSFNEFCERINNKSLTYEICKEIIPTINEYKYQENVYQARILKRLEYDLIAILPDLDQRNSIDNAKVSANDYQFSVNSQKPYEWKHQHDIEIDMPNIPIEGRTGMREAIEEHVEQEVNEELGQVYYLIQTMNRDSIG